MSSPIRPPTVTSTSAATTTATTATTADTVNTGTAAVDINNTNSSFKAKNIIIVLSGKGGVGKSTVACQLAIALAFTKLGNRNKIGIAAGGDEGNCDEGSNGERGDNSSGGDVFTYAPVRVGILDVDICGPSVPLICGAAKASVTSDKRTGKWFPVVVEGDDGEEAGGRDRGETGPGVVSGIGRGRLEIMSIAYLLPNATDAVVWRGPRKNAMMGQFFTQVAWGEPANPNIIRTRVSRKQKRSDGEEIGVIGAEKESDKSLNNVPGVPPPTQTKGTCESYLDYLIVDTPPGTSDEHLSLCELLHQQLSSCSSLPSFATSSPPSKGAKADDKENYENNSTKRDSLQPDLDPVVVGAVIVTTPQEVALDDVRKELSLCHKLNLRVLGIVENMSGYVCPHCSECTYLFSRGGGKALAEAYQCPFLGYIPIDPRISFGEDNGDLSVMASMIDQEEEEEKKKNEKANSDTKVASMGSNSDIIDDNKDFDRKKDNSGFVSVVRNILAQLERARSVIKQQKKIRY